MGFGRTAIPLSRCLSLTATECRLVSRVVSVPAWDLQRVFRVSDPLLGCFDVRLFWVVHPVWGVGNSLLSEELARTGDSFPLWCCCQVHSQPMLRFGEGGFSKPLRK